MNNRLAQQFSEKGLLPDGVVRAGIRRLLKERLQDIQATDLEASARRQTSFIEAMSRGPIADVPEKANEQHYELPTEFFLSSLGAHSKYSCGLWSEGIDTLDASEAAGLTATCHNADLRDGQNILELGCGWGSLTLWMARHFPNSEITAVSNSVTQGAHIRQQALLNELTNVTVMTSDMNDFEPPGRYDRVVSVEMFEHMRNWKKLYARVAGCLVPEGKFFKHIFLHRSTPYFFEERGDSDWMSRYFFSGGMMPSVDLPLCFQDELRFEQRWLWSGEHYEKTSNAWLKKMDTHQTQLMPLFETTYGKDVAVIWWNRWRMFFMACAELFGFNDGQEWLVGHYLFSKRALP